jgi:glycosyltransferase involved in cell wall biosynthesis
MMATTRCGDDCGREAFPGPGRRLRVACLATSAGHSGGAAIAMERLAAGLRAEGTRVDVLTRDDLPPLEAGPRRLERRIRRALREARTPLSNTLFTADWPAWDLADHPAVAAADLVNVHWVAGFLAAAGIRRLAESGRRVAWTLHDMRPFTGGCHYAAGCRGFTGSCTACPQVAAAVHDLPVRSLARARRRLAGVPLVFVCPSRWLAGELVRSSLFDPRAHQVRVIPNGLDLARYRPADSAAARRRLGLPAEGLGILLGSVSLAERRKGNDAAVAAVTRAAAAIAARGLPPPVVITTGADAPAVPGLACHHLGSLDEAGVLAAIQACDLHLTMAREDNLPNTVMEALACGRPVLATRAGGIPELVGDGAEGWLVDTDDTVGAAAVLARLAGEPAAVAAAGRAARRRAEEAWDARLQARRYLELAAPSPAAAAPPEIRPSGPGAARPAACTPAAAVVVQRGGSLRGPLRSMRRLVARSGPATAPRRPPVRPFEAADFQKVEFPEQAFPPAPAGAEAYFSACRRGYATMADRRVVITGLARDLGEVLPVTIQRIENLGRRFADYRVVVYENDSRDDTRDELIRWAKSNRRVELITERRADPVNPTTRCLDRAARMAAYRTRCQEVVLATWAGFDATIIIDFDILGGFSSDGIASSFGQPGWDFVGSNGLICRRHGLRMNALRQYDTWALRFDAALTPLSTSAAGGRVYERGEPLVPVTSCFGGLGIYTMEAFRAGRYGTDDLEHATFHRSLQAAGFGRLFLNPSQLVIYGRRHRFGDRLVAALVHLSGTGGGRPELFARDRQFAAAPPAAARVRQRPDAAA